MSEWKDVAPIVGAIPSWVTQNEAAYLFSLVKPNDGCVDVGGGRGKTAIVMSLASQNVVSVVSLWNVPGEGVREEMVTNAALAGAPVVHVLGDSLMAAERAPMSDVVFIDADHSYKAVKADILAWGKVVKPGGIIAFHDCDSVNHPGVSKAIKKCMVWPKIGQVESLAAYRRPIDG